MHEAVRRNHVPMGGGPQGSKVHGNEGAPAEELSARLPDGPDVGGTRGSHRRQPVGQGVDRRSSDLPPRAIPVLDQNLGRRETASCPSLCVIPDGPDVGRTGACHAHEFGPAGRRVRRAAPRLAIPVQDERLEGARLGVRIAATAQASDGEIAVTPLSELGPGRLAGLVKLGLATTFQAVPFQCSIRFLLGLSGPVRYEPTAHASVAEVTATELSSSVRWGPPGFLLGACRHTRPFQCSMKVLSYKCR